MAGFAFPTGYSAIRRSLNLSRRRIFILPSSAGLLFGVALTVMLLGAINYDNSLAYGLTFLIGSLMPVTILHTYRNLAGLQLSTAAPEPVFAGETAHLPVVLDNRGLAARFSIDLRYLPGQRQRGRPRAATVTVSLPADKLHTVELPLPAQSRGIHVLRRIRMASSFPLGLFRTWSDFHGEQTAVVYPKPAGRLPLPAPIDYEGEDSIGQLSGSDDFIGFRNYHPGDSTRRIDWKAVARGQELLVKRFAGSGSRQIEFNWDHTRALGDTESRLSQLCRWVVDAERQGLRYRLRLPGFETPLDQGSQHRHLCLLALARFRS